MWSGARAGQSGGVDDNRVDAPHTQPAASPCWGARAVESPAIIASPGGNTSTSAGATPGAAR